jgi:hypothetical protein
VHDEPWAVLGDGLFQGRKALGRGQIGLDHVGLSADRAHLLGHLLQTGL